VAARTRIAEAFEAHKGSRVLTVGLFDGFLHTYSHGPPVRKASTMWTVRSHLVRYIHDRYRTDYSDVGTYKQLLAQKSKEEKPVQAEIFDKDELFRFVKEAPSEKEMLRHKIVALVAYYGACRIADIVYLEFKDIKVEDVQISVTIQRSKSAAAAATTTFIIPNTELIDVVAIFNLYVSQQNPSTGRFWRQYRYDRWISSCVGHNTLANTARIIAAWLGKENADAYTGHCFRRSSATAFADATGDKISLKRLGGWRSDTVVERYIAESKHEKKKQAMALGPDDTAPVAPQPDPQPSPERPYNITFQNCSNITLNIR
jgi:integrase